METFSAVRKATGMPIRTHILAAAMAFPLLGAAPALAEAPPKVCALALGETVYIPAVSHINTNEYLRQPLASTLVIHNIDAAVPITVTAVGYYDNDGALVTDMLSAPRTLNPFASTSFLTELSDTRGGVGANYILEWTSAAPACSPETMAIMIGGTGTQGISFSLPGRVIDRTSPPAE